MSKVITYCACFSDTGELCCEMVQCSSFTRFAIEHCLNCYGSKLDSSDSDTGGKFWHRNVTEVGVATCATPENLTGRRIATLPENLFICECNASTSVLNSCVYPVSRITRHCITHYKVSLYHLSVEGLGKQHCLKQPCVCVLLHCYLARTFQNAVLPFWCSLKIASLWLRLNWKQCS